MVLHEEVRQQDSGEVYDSNDRWVQGERGIQLGIGCESLFVSIVMDRLTDEG